MDFVNRRVRERRRWLHPYSIALDLGKQIRFSMPLEQITAELDNAAHKQLSAEAKGAAIEHQQYQR